jgi:hypothetical protein
LKSSGRREPPQHQTRHGEVNYGLTALGQPFIVFAQAACLVEPRQGAFDHPSTREKHNTFGPFRTSRDTQDEAHMLAAPFHQLASLRAINPEQPQLFPGATAPCQAQAGPCWVGHRSGRDDHDQQEPQRIDHQMACAPLDVFAFIVAALSAQCCRLDPLAVETARCGMFVAPRLLAHLGAQGVVEALPVPAGAPWTDIPVHTGPFGLCMGEHPPCDAPVNDIQQGIEHRPHIELAGAPTRLGWWDHLFDTIPFGISEVCGVWMSVHPQSVLH